MEIKFFKNNKFILLFNGEIYNHKELKQKYFESEFLKAKLIQNYYLSF